MPYLLKQSTAKAISFGPFVDKTDGVTPETGLVSALDHASTGIMLSKNGGALTIRHASVTASTYDAYGNYIVTLDTTDTNTLGTLRMQFIETATCLPVWMDFMVVPANIFDSLVSGSDLVDVSVTQFAGSAITSAAGIPEVKVASIAANAITSTAINADAITAAKVADGTIDAATFAAGAINAAAIADGAIDAATFAAGAINAAAIADSAIDRATFAADTGLQSIRSNTAAAGAATTITLDASASATNDLYKDSLIYITGGTGIGQLRLCISYVGATQVATVSHAWATNPDNTSTFAILPVGPAALRAIAGAALSTSTAQLGVNTVQAGGTAWGSGAITAASIATDAIDADALAADAVTEIQNGLATPTNITAGTITTVTNLTNAPTNGDLTAAMKTSVTTACTASTPTAAAVTGAVGSVTGNVGGNVTGSVGSLATQAKADVNAEVVDCLNVDTYAEPGQEAPAATNTLSKKIGYLFKLLRNKVTQTSTTLSIYDDAGTTVDQKATVSDDATTYTRGEIGSGP